MAAAAVACRSRSGKGKPVIICISSDEEDDDEFEVVADEEEETAAVSFSCLGKPATIYISSDEEEDDEFEVVVVDDDDVESEAESIEDEDENLGLTNQDSVENQWKKLMDARSVFDEIPKRTGFDFQVFEAAQLIGEITQDSIMSPELIGKLFSIFSTIEQEDPLEDYVARFVMLARFTHEFLARANREVDEEHFLEMFVFGLLPDIMFPVMEHKPKSVFEAIQFARYEDKLQELRRGKRFDEMPTPRMLKCTSQDYHESPLQDEYRPSPKICSDDNCADGNDVKDNVNDNGDDDSKEKSVGEEFCNKIIDLLRGRISLNTLKLEECRAYLRKHKLNMIGSKETCTERILEHWRIKDGNGKKFYPESSFFINCTGDVCRGDVVLFKHRVYNKGGGANITGKRIVAGRVVNDSYRGAEQRHIFSIDVLWSEGIEPLPSLFPLLVSGHNLYRFKSFRQPWSNEAERSMILAEKHNRGAAARHVRALARAKATEKGSKRKRSTARAIAPPNKKRKHDLELTGGKQKKNSTKKSSNVCDNHDSQDGQKKSWQDENKHVMQNHWEPSTVKITKCTICKKTCHEVKNRWKGTGACLRCGDMSHKKAKCPKKKPPQKMPPQDGQPSEINQNPHAKSRVFSLTNKEAEASNDNDMVAGSKRKRKTTGIEAPLGKKRKLELKLAGGDQKNKSNKNSSNGHDSHGGHDGQTKSWQNNKQQMMQKDRGPPIQNIIRCTVCKKFGHGKKFCWKAIGACRKCGDRSHKIAECPKNRPPQKMLPPNCQPSEMNRNTQDSLTNKEAEANNVVAGMIFLPFVYAPVIFNFGVFPFA